MLVICVTFIWYTLVTGTSDSRTSSNSSLNRLGNQPSEHGKVESTINHDQKSSMAANATLDSPISTSSSHSNLSYDYSTQVCLYNNNTKRDVIFLIKGTIFNILLCMF